MKVDFCKISFEDKEIFLEMCGEFYGSPAVLHKIPKSHMENTFDEIMRGSPYAECYIIKADGEICGYVLLALSFSNEAGGKVIWIEELYVRENMRGMGIAKKFFDFIKKEDFAAIRLEVEPDNVRAVKLYTSLGFKNLGYAQYIFNKT